MKLTTKAAEQIQTMVAPAVRGGRGLKQTRENAAAQLREVAPAVRGGRGLKRGYAHAVTLAVRWRPPFAAGED